MDGVATTVFGHRDHLPLGTLTESSRSGTCMTCDSAAADTRDEDDAAAASKTFHLPSCRLRSEENTIEVYVHHLGVGANCDLD